MCPFTALQDTAMMVTRLCCTKDIMAQDIPATQYAVELTGPDELCVNSHKEVGLWTKNAEKELLTVAV